MTGGLPVDEQFVPGRPADWSGPVVELERLELRAGDGDLGARLRGLLDAHGLGGPLGSGPGDTGVGLLLGADACAALAGLPTGPATPVPGVPDLVAVVVRRGGPGARAVGPAGTGDWTTTWDDREHGGAVERVREAIGRGALYQANVVGHRSAPAWGDPLSLARAVALLPGAAYGGVLEGEGWAVGCASPEQLLHVEGDRITTRPVKGTRVAGPGAQAALLASDKDRAEHVMIVDLERNDLSRVCRTGTVEVEELYALHDWSGLWHAGSTVAGRLVDGVTALDVLAALAPGGSVTGAPKRAACALLADLEPVGRGPAMGALGFLSAGRLDLGLTIRTVAVADGLAHVWAGGGITWGSDAAAEVAEAHAKAAPVLRALGALGAAQVRPSSS